jgi:glycosyltransferase involved in cell wall biosynthesis
MRVLFVVLSPVRPELGAAQIAIRVAEALRSLGTDAVVWTPHPVAAGVPWWKAMGWVRRRIAEYVERNGPFDFVDLPPVAVTRKLARMCPAIARSVQPDLAYLWAEMRFSGRIRRLSLAVKAIAALHNVYLCCLVVHGWLLARHVICLGSAEFNWMRRWLPWWRCKLSYYVSAIATADRKVLAEIRSRRANGHVNEPSFLWLGRWAAQKGPDILVEFVRRSMAAGLQFKLTIAGFGPGIERILPPVLRNSRNIRLVPTYDREGLYKLLEQHDAGLFTSRFEGWGLTLHEMLESGMPVYATNAGAVIDLRAEFGDQLRPFPPSGPLPKAPQGSCPLPFEYLQRFSWAAVAERYLEVLRSLGET